jgi:hypothetical protein
VLRRLVGRKLRRQPILRQTGVRRGVLPKKRRRPQERHHGIRRHAQYRSQGLSSAPSLSAKSSKNRLPRKERWCLNTGWPVVGMISSCSTLRIIARTFNICAVSAFS